MNLQEELAGKALFVVSDLHVGDKSARDNFYHSGGGEAFNSFLAYVKEQPNAHLIILGDLFEFWQTNLSEVILGNLELMDRIIAAVPFTYVIGNHDIDLVKFVGTDFLNHPFFRRMTEDFTFTLGGKKVAFLHGHEVDGYNAGVKPGKGRMLSIFAGTVEDETGSPFIGKTDKTWEQTLAWVGEKSIECFQWIIKRAYGIYKRVRFHKCGAEQATPSQKESHAVENRRMMKKYREEKNLAAVVCGHTHQAGRSGDWYFNAGTWTAKRNTFLKISSFENPPAFKVEILEWKDGEFCKFENPIAI